LVRRTNEAGGYGSTRSIDVSPIRQGRQVLIAQITNSHPAIELITMTDDASAARSAGWETKPEEVLCASTGGLQTVELPQIKFRPLS
jgi:hypothetical protein